MINQDKIKELLRTMTKDTNSNLLKIRNVFQTLKYKDETNQSLLHILVDDKYDEIKCLLAIKTLLKAGLNPNLEDEFEYNFIQTALYAGYSENFILDIIKEALKYKLNVNHVDSDKDTIMHTAIYSDDYLDNIEKIYILLCSNGFDSTKKDQEGRDLVEAMIFQEQYSSLQIKRFRQLFNNQINSISPTNPNKQLSESQLLELERYGKVLNKKNYIVSPTIGREKEFKNLIITLAQDKKRPLIVGESGVGKTSLVDELVYQIKTNNVPDFLQEKIILEINPNELVAGCSHVGEFEEKMTNLMNLCEKYDVIVFIDEIHTIYGVGSSNKNNNDMAVMLKYYIDRTNLKVIGTTTENEYNEFFANGALKRRFEIIKVLEPTTEILYKIVDKILCDYSINYDLLFESDNIKKQIVSIIISATEKKHRVYNDIVNNPDLSVSIIDRAYAIARVYNSEFITPEHFIESFEYCDRIYEPAKKQTISRLKNIDAFVSKQNSKILTLNINNPK